MWGMATRSPIANDEWYHCFNRGVDKRRVFMDKRDCDRFLLLLYLCNDSTSSVNLAELRHIHTLERLLARNGNDYVRGTPLIEIGAYALMRNHVHVVLKQLVENGLALFMQKVFTGYTMYFNKKHERTGALFAGSYKSRHIANDEYFKHAIQYVLFNPIELFEPGWKKGIGNLKNVEKWLREYKYSSLPDFISEKRPENSVVADIRSEYFHSVPTLTEMLTEAQEYYQENAKFLER